MSQDFTRQISAISQTVIQIHKIQMQQIKQWTQRSEVKLMLSLAHN